MTKYLLLASISLVLPLVGCADPPPEPEPEPLEFTVVDSLLGGVARDTTLGVEFRPPVGWAEAESARLEEFLEQLERFNHYQRHFDFRARFLFEDTTSGGALLVSVVEHPRWSGDKARRDFELHVESAFEDSEAKRSRFKIGDLPVTQFMVSRNELAALKLLVVNPRGEVIQFDYLVPGAAFADVSRAIESSIGAISLTE
ncbi:MAG: hypothetical protein GF419_02160 [Ignavibacteriales bacterium]|nr:hypothetical protein [Ignavibacteriales bacterium]